MGMGRLYACEHAYKRRQSKRCESWLDQELSTPHCGALCRVRGKRKWSCELVIRSRMIIGAEHDGHLSWLVDASCGEDEGVPSSARQRRSDAARLRFAKSPK